ncbi:hypothetical protein DAI22_07g269900 [Oryza sativa Japonica Group]|nr:hypothetical protein DAI22_07g269900 [Oryza sativa Japonica Group]
MLTYPKASFGPALELSRSPRPRVFSQQRCSSPAARGLLLPSPPAPTTRGAPLPPLLLLRLSPAAEVLLRVCSLCNHCLPFSRIVAASAASPGPGAAVGRSWRGGRHGAGTGEDGRSGGSLEPTATAAQLLSVGRRSSLPATAPICWPPPLSPGHRSSAHSFSLARAYRQLCVSPIIGRQEERGSDVAASCSRAAPVGLSRRPPPLTPSSSLRKRAPPPPRAVARLWFSLPVAAIALAPLPVAKEER